MTNREQFRLSDTPAGVPGRGLRATGLRLRLSRELSAAIHALRKGGTGQLLPPSS